MMKIAKIEEIVKLMENKGPEVMKSIESEGICVAVQRLVSESDANEQKEKIAIFEMPKLEGLKDDIKRLIDKMEPYIPQIAVQ